VHEVLLQQLDPEDRHPLAHSISTDEVHIPLTLKGTMSGFDTCKPTLDKVQDIMGVTCVHVHLTPTAPWDPQTCILGACVHPDIKGWGIYAPPEFQDKISVRQEGAESSQSKVKDINTLTLMLD
jgi:hypothetical protein